MSRIRLAIAAGVVVLIILVGAHDPWAYAIAIAAFLVAVVVHARVLDRCARQARAVAFYERGLDRLHHRWMGHGDAGERYRIENHPYADDLDLFGRGSLFELIGTGRTQAGQDTLAAWLAAPATPDEVAARHDAVRELVPRLDLRERLSLDGDAISDRERLATLRAWALAPPRLSSMIARVAVAMTAVAIVVLGVWWASAERISPMAARVLLGVAVFQGVVVLVLRPRVRAVMRDIESAMAQLTLLSGVLRTIESERFTSPRLTRIADAIGGHARVASAEIARLQRLVALLESRANIIFGPPSAAVAWATQVTSAMEAWRVRLGTRIVGWIDAVGEFEALASMATYAAERPSHVFPIFVEPPAVVSAIALAHPLLPDDAVGNDVTIGGDAPHVLIVSGSNMSGKSTLLRAVGANVVLAQAGLPVRSSSFRLAPLAIGASIRIVDSLQDGRSKFFAEILRLKMVVELARRHPGATLFLLDEVLGGTNSHDRRRGAEAIVMGLVSLGAIGLVTTHDLAIGDVASRLPHLVDNVHFADELDEGGLRFDYHLRPGLVRTSNALALMRSIGLDVGGDTGSEVDLA